MNRPAKWFKLKREDGRVVMGSREYKEPDPKGTFIGGVTRRDEQGFRTDVTDEYIVHNGREEHYECHHGQARRAAENRAVALFEGK